MILVEQDSNQIIDMQSTVVVGRKDGQIMYFFDDDKNHEDVAQVLANALAMCLSKCEDEVFGDLVVEQMMHVRREYAKLERKERQELETEC